MEASAARAEVIYNSIVVEHRVTKSRQWVASVWLLQEWWWKDLETLRSVLEPGVLSLTHISVCILLKWQIKPDFNTGN